MEEVIDILRVVYSAEYGNSTRANFPIKQGKRLAKFYHMSTCQDDATVEKKNPGQWKRIEKLLATKETPLITRSSM